MNTTVVADSPAILQKYTHIHLYRVGEGSMFFFNSYQVFEMKPNQKCSKRVVMTTSQIINIDTNKMLKLFP